MKQVPIFAAMIVLRRDRRFLMQLRDDKEGIVYPGQWGLFGGHLESGELPQEGLIREIKEELNYVVQKPTFFRCYKSISATRYIFYADLDVEIKSLELNEGKDLDLVPLSNIRLGRHYSPKVQEERHLGSIHQQILLDFAIFTELNP